MSIVLEIVFVQYALCTYFAYCALNSEIFHTGKIDWWIGYLS